MKCFQRMMTSRRAWMWCVHWETCCPLGNCTPPPLPTWPSRPAHSALFTGPCNAQIHQPEQFLSRPGIFFSPKNRPYFGCGIYIYIVDAVKKTRRNITQFLSWQLLPSKFMWKDPWLELCGNLISAAPVKTSPKAVYVIMNTIISNDSNIQISKKKNTISLLMTWGWICTLRNVELGKACLHWSLRRGSQVVGSGWEGLLQVNNAQLQTRNNSDKGTFILSHPSS